MNNSRSSSKATAEDNRQTLLAWRTANREDDHSTAKSVKHVKRWLMMEGLAKAVDVEPLTPRQRRIVMLVFTEGVQQLRYKSMGRNETLISWIGIRTGIHRSHVGVTIRELEALEYVERVVYNDEQWLWITGGIFHESIKVEHRWDLRRYVGEAWPEVERFGLDEVIERVYDLQEADSRRWSPKVRAEIYDLVLAEVYAANYPRAEGMPDNMRHLLRHKARKAR